MENENDFRICQGLYIMKHKKDGREKELNVFKTAVVVFIDDVPIGTFTDLLFEDREKLVKKVIQNFCSETLEFLRENGKSHHKYYLEEEKNGVYKICKQSCGFLYNGSVNPIHIIKIVEIPKLRVMQSEL